MSSEADVSEVSFGIVALGFSFRRSVQLCNRHTLPERIRITVSSLHPEEPNVLRVLTAPKTLAPGMTMQLELELHAHSQRHSTFLVQVVSPLGCRDVVVTASVVNQGLFDSLSKTLKHEGRTVLDPAVRLSGRLPKAGGAPASVSEAESSESDSVPQRDDDLDSIPLTPATYWDPWQQVLKLDPQLLAVETNPDWSLEAAKRHNEERIDRRLDELEGLGMITLRRKTARASRSHG